MADASARLAAALADRYAIERELGQGGMATVYLAQDLKHDRQVAIKVLKPELAAVLGASGTLAGVVLLGAVGRAAEPASADVAPAYGGVLYPAVHLTQALLRLGKVAPLFLVTRGARAAVELSLSRRLAVELHVDGLQALTTTRFLVDHMPAWATDPRELWVGAGVEATFP